MQFSEAVARHLSYTRAAVELHLTQPSASMQVRQLEQAVGLPLFEQLGKKLFLTDAGHELQNYSRNIADQLAEVESVLGELKGLRRGKLRGTVAQAFKQFLLDSK